MLQRLRLVSGARHFISADARSVTKTLRYCRFLHGNGNDGNGKTNSASQENGAEPRVSNNGTTPQMTLPELEKSWQESTEKIKDLEVSLLIYGSRNRCPTWNH